ncbi:MAG: hypothetical protein AAB488_00120 [Patescibacteria group bacterium]
MSNDNSSFKTTSNGYGIQPINGITPPMGGGVHDTFQVDQNGNINNGHTTVEIPGGQKINIPWDK